MIDNKPQTNDAGASQVLDAQAWALYMATKPRPPGISTMPEAIAWGRARLLAQDANEDGEDLWA